MASGSRTAGHWTARLLAAGVLLALAGPVAAQTGAGSSGSVGPGGHTTSMVSQDGKRFVSMTIDAEQGPTLATHPKERFREIVRCFTRYKGAIWFGTYGRGLFRLADGKLENLTHANSSLVEDRVNCLAVRSDELWVGTCAGINVVDGSGAWRLILESDGVADHIFHVIETDSRNRVWVGTVGKGLSVWDGKTWRTFTATKDRLAGDWVNDVQETPDGCLWAATISGLSRRCGEGRWTHQMGREFPIYANATALALQGDSLWVGFANDGLFVWEGGMWLRPPPRLLPAPTVRTMTIDGSKALWVGTESGVACYDVKRDFETQAANAGLEDRNIRALYCDPDTGDLYAGSVGGWVYRRGSGDTRWHILVRQGRLVVAPATRKEMGK
ncbi:MAG: hypothetical protein HY814_00680 [Candidatus Riflebacteria bacterium]|nr:hypothetical protein [Candidatus Riflebacteria bacterium]